MMKRKGMQSRSICTFVFFCLSISLLFLCIFYSNTSHAADLFVTTGGSGTVCSQAQPCDLQTALTQSSGGDSVYVAAGTYTGTGDNVIDLTKNVNLLGGWDGSSSNGIVRDPGTYKSILDGENSRRVVHISGNTLSPTIDGFTITRGNATGLTTNCAGYDGGAPDGCGGGIFIYEANPVISNNIISYNVSAVTTYKPTSYFGYGGGIYLRGCASAEVINNEITGNIGSLANYGSGGGIYLCECNAGTWIENNHFINNSGTTFIEPGYGGAICIEESDPLVQNNIIDTNQAALTDPYSSGSGIHVWCGAPHIRNNTIIGNRRGIVVVLGYFTGTFEMNRVLENDAIKAINIVNGYAISGLTIVNNTIAKSGTTYTVYIDASVSWPLSASLMHNTLVGNNAAYGVYIESYSGVSMSNNIVTGHSVSGVTVTDGTSTLSQDHTLFFGNTSDGERGTNPVDGDPAFKNDYHIKGNSVAKDAGAVSGVTNDIDNDSRPWGSGYDIGADEFVVRGGPGVNYLLLKD